MSNGDSGGETDNPEPSTEKEGGDAAANGVENAPPYKGDGVPFDASTSMSGDPGDWMNSGNDSALENEVQEPPPLECNDIDATEDALHNNQESPAHGGDAAANGVENASGYERTDDAGTGDGERGDNVVIQPGKEQEAYNKLETIKNSSNNWVCQIKERTPFSEKLGEVHERFPNAFKHTFLEFINFKGGEAEIVTISYNGLKGEWWINTEEDINSQQNSKKWSVADVTPENGINIEATINNIHKMILSQEDSYVLIDGLYDWNLYNCNAAAKSVTVENKDKK